MVHKSAWEYARMKNKLVKRSASISYKGRNYRIASLTSIGHVVLHDEIVVHPGDICEPVDEAAKAYHDMHKLRRDEAERQEARDHSAKLENLIRTFLVKAGHTVEMPPVYCDSDLRHEIERQLYALLKEIPKGDKADEPTDKKLVYLGEDQSGSDWGIGLYDYATTTHIISFPAHDSEDSTRAYNEAFEYIERQRWEHYDHY